MLDLDAIQRLCVIAPHPDDESLGCGGLIALLAKRGCSIAVVFVTDGGASHRASKAWPRERLAAARKDEAMAALGHLGALDAQVLFLGLPDAAMPTAGTSTHERAKAQLTALLARLSPDLIIMPWRRDPHCDHRDSWQLTQDAMVDAGVQAQQLEYAIWLDELGHDVDRPRASEAGRISIDIKAVRHQKQEAVEAHLTQTTALIDDDPSGFRLTAKTINRLVGSSESYWRPLS